MNEKLFDIEKSKKNRKNLDESLILGNTIIAGTIVFPILLIILVLIIFLPFNINPFLIGISAFIINIIISICYYLCQKKKKCKINSISNK